MVPGGSERGGRGRVRAALAVRFNDLDVVFNSGSESSSLCYLRLRSL
jgi:hypothetical protein